MPINQTYFILSREIFSSAIWLDNPHVLKLFIYLIGDARYKKEPKKYPKFQVKRGEVLTSLHILSEANEYIERGTLKKWSRAKVSRMLKVLEEQKYIKVLADTYGTHVSICNYNIYQDPSTYKANTSETQPNGSENNSKKGKKEKNKDIDQRIIDIVGILNSICGTGFWPSTPKTQSVIMTHLNTGRSIDDFRAVIQTKYDEWAGTDMARFLRPETLFSGKFESYLQQKAVKPKTSGHDEVQL